MSWQDDVRQAKHQEAKEQELKNEEKRIKLEKITEFWNKLIVANDKLASDIKLNVTNDKEYPTIVGQNGKVLRLYINVPVIVEDGSSNDKKSDDPFFDGARDFHIGYDTEKLKLYGATKLYGNGYYYSTRYYDINDSSFDILLKNLCQGTNLFEGLTKESGGGSSGCFIATVVYGSPFTPDVELLRAFRDNVLVKNKIGKAFVNNYYLISPPIADFISNKIILKKFVRMLLSQTVVKYLRYINKSNA